MSKIMVVEDDASLREIYSIRITAEGYDVVSAGDGEEALAVAVREKPNLILSDVMMPKISGFDMLDILRSTPETATIKVIMMTALSADDQRQRGERLGADRYLVKSQVGIEDVINTIHEVLGDKEVNPQAVASAPSNVNQDVPEAIQSPAPEQTAQTSEVLNAEQTQTTETQAVASQPTQASDMPTPEAMQQVSAEAQTQTNYEQPNEQPVDQPNSAQ